MSSLGVILNGVMFGTLSGFVTICFTLIIEQQGGVIGGVVASAPSLVIPTSISFFLQLTSSPPPPSSPYPSAFEEYRASMLSVPFGSLISCLVVLFWRVVPPRVKIESPLLKISTLLGTSILLWLGLATLSVRLIHTIPPVSNTQQWYSLAALSCHFLIAASATLRENVSAPKGKRKPSPLALFFRGFLSFAASFVSILLVEFAGPVVSGLSSTFPVIFLTTIVSIWISQGEKVVQGTTGPLMLGNISVVIYAFASIQFYFSLGLTLGVLASFSVSMLYSIPLALLLRWKQNQGIQKHFSEQTA